MKAAETQPNPDFQLPPSLQRLHSSSFCYKEIFFVTPFALTGFDLRCSDALLCYILSVFHLPAFPHPNDAHRDVIFSLLFFYYHLIWPLPTFFSATRGLSLGALLSSHPDFMRSIYFHVCLPHYVPIFTSFALRKIHMLLLRSPWPLTCCSLHL